MNRKWMRILSTLMCLALLLTSAPVGAEEFIENIAEEGGADAVGIETPAAVPEAEPILEDASVEEIAEEAPVEEPAEAPTEEIPVEEPTEAPMEEIPVEEPAEAPAEELPEELPPLEELVSQWIEALNAQGLNGDYRKAFWLYDRLIANFERGSADDPQTALMTYSASPLGYAYAYAALAQAAGIVCVAIVAENTAWNAAKIDGEWTHIDAWMDDAEDSFGLHFGLTDAAMARDHAWESSTSPVCVDTHNNYFVRERGYQAFASEDELRALLISAKESQATELYLYNAGERPVIGEAIGALLAEMETVAAETYEQGCYAAVQLRYIEPAPTPDPDGIFSVFVPDVPDTMESTEEVPATAKPATAESIVPKASSLTLDMGETASVAGWTMLPAGVLEEVTYTSNDEDIATVDADGKVTARKAGSTTITIRAASGVSCGVSVTVVAAPTSIQVTAPKTEIGVGEKMQLGYTLSPGSTGKVRFYILENLDVGSVTTDGEFTALKAGKVTVSVKTYNGKIDRLTLTVKAAPASVKLTAPRTELAVGETMQLGYTLPSGSAGKAHFYILENQNVASVTSGGEFTALQAGKVTVSVKTYNSKINRLTITVKPAPTSVKFSAQSATLGVGDSCTPTVTLSSGAVGQVSFSSSNMSIAKVSATSGKITAVAEGEAVITARTYNGKTATLKVTVAAAPADIQITAPRTEIGVGEKMQLGYTLPSGSAGRAHFYILEDLDVGSVTSSGEFTALKAGKVTVSAKTYNGKINRLTLTVKAAPTSVKLTAPRTELGVGESMQLGYTLPSGSAGKAHFYILENQDVASVTSSGEFTALEAGEVTVSVKTYNSKINRATITVKPTPTSVKFSATSATIGVGDSYTPTVTLNSGSAGQVSFSSSNKAIAKVGATSGKITAVAEGEAVITARTYNGMTATLTVTVVAAPASIQLTAPRTEIGVGESMQLGYTFPSGSAGKAHFYILEDLDVGSVTSDGKFTALKPGKVTVSVKSHNGKIDRLTITVKAAPTSITLTAPRTELGAGESMQLGYTLPSGSAGKAHFYILENQNVASVTSSGEFTALEAGEVTVSVKTYNSKIGRLTINVKPAPTSVTFSAKNVTLGVDKTCTPTVRLNSGAAGQVSFSSSDKAIAKVDATSGKITAVAEGEAVITARTYNGVTATLTVTVLPAPTKLVLEQTSLTVGVGDRFPLAFSTVPESAYAEYNYSSSNEAVAPIDEQGVISAMLTGSSTITVTAHNGVSAKLKLKVVKHSIAHPPYVVAHRGASGYRKQNTLAAFEYAIKLGAEYIEMDVRKTKDNQLVIVHDASVGSRSVAGSTLSQLKQANADLVTLDETLAFLSEGDVKLMIELKVSGIEQQVLDLVAKYGMQSRAVVGSLTASISTKLKTLDPSALVIYGVQTSSELNDIINNPSKYRAEYVTAKYTLLNATNVRTLHLLGYEVFAWTVNSTYDIQRMVDLGVDGITTNYPDRL